MLFTDLLQFFNCFLLSDTMSGRPFLTSELRYFFLYLTPGSGNCSRTGKATLRKVSKESEGRNLRDDEPFYVMNRTSDAAIMVAPKTYLLNNLHIFGKVGNGD